MECMTAYSTRHWRVRKVRGPAKEQDCSHCPRQALDWALLHGEDGEDPQSYIPLCRRCHLAYDGSGHRKPHTEATKALLSQKNTGYRHTPEAIAKIRAASAGRTMSADARAKVSAARRGHDVTQDQRDRISARLKGNTNASGARSPEALANIRRGQQERRRREREGGGSENGIRQRQGQG